jgi:hypothetical protein
MESSKRYEERKRKKEKKKKIKSHEIVRVLGAPVDGWIGCVAEDRGDEPSVTANGSTRCFCCSFLAYSCGLEV